MRRSILPLLALMPFLAFAAAPVQEAAAQGVAAPQAQQPARRYTARRIARAGTNGQAGQYFVEFRSRHALSYGHTFLVYGRLNGRGEVGTLSAANVAGFHPAGAGAELWTLGHVVPVASETGPSDGDLEEIYVSARYRVILSEAEFRRVAATIRQKQQTQALWHATMYNCNAWVGEVARSMGLQTPLSPILYPANYINEMRRLNTGETVASGT